MSPKIVPARPKKKQMIEKTVMDGGKRGVETAELGFWGLRGLEE